MVSERQRATDEALTEADEDSPASRPLYHTDIATWAREQAEALGRRDANSLDWDHLIEELDQRASLMELEWKSACTGVIEAFLTFEHARQLPEMFHWQFDVATKLRIDMLLALNSGDGLRGG